jgi:hypothetical protein
MSVPIAKTAANAAQKAVKSSSSRWATALKGNANKPAPELSMTSIDYWMQPKMELPLLAVGAGIFAGLGAWKDAIAVKDSYESSTGKPGIVPATQESAESFVKRFLGIGAGGAVGWLASMALIAATPLRKLPLVAKWAIAWLPSKFGAYLGNEFVKFYVPSTGMKIRQSEEYDYFKGQRNQLNAAGVKPWDTDKLDPYGAYYGYRKGIDGNNDGFIDGEAPLALRDAAEIRAEDDPRHRHVNGKPVSPRHNPPPHERHPFAPPYGDNRREGDNSQFNPSYSYRDGGRSGQLSGQSSGQLSGQQHQDATPFHQWGRGNNDDAPVNNSSPIFRPRVPSGSTLLEAFKNDPDDTVENLYQLANDYTGGYGDAAINQRKWL